jgi:Methyltransferase domain
MQLSARNIAKVALAAAIAPLGLELRAHDWSDTRNFIPFHDTIEAARRAGMSVGDYIDTEMSKTPGATAATVDGMRQLGVFASPIGTVVEIGPGSGRSLEKTIAACQPQRYEIYETAPHWNSYLATTYPVVAQPTDGKSLAATPDASVDLVHAHKVFSSIPSLPTWIYWSEMCRVCAPNGHVVFDILTEACLDLKTLEAWIESGIDNGAFPAVMPRALALDYFASRGFEAIGTFQVPLGVDHTTEVFVFRKQTA